jgi:hypothetical protein
MSMRSSVAIDVIALLLLTAASAIAAPVIPPGHEDRIATMMGRQALLPGSCRLTSGQIEARRIGATYECAGGEVAVELRHPDDVPAGTPRTQHFGIVILRGHAPPELLEELQARIRAAEAGFEWIDAAGRPAYEVALLIAAYLLPAAVLIFALAGLHATLRPLPKRHGTLRWVQLAGLCVVAVVALISAGRLNEELAFKLVTAFGMLWVGGFLWLAASGFPSNAGIERRDWIAGLPFVVALIVREAFTLHSVQEIEIQFALGPTGRHSVVYPLLQLLYSPFVADPHSFTMHLNGVLGAVACLPLYLFVRRGCDSPAAGFACAMFFAAHPLVARFAPTDGPYSLLLLTWFAGLALLSTPHLGARALRTGITLLGIAATLRIEGMVYLVAGLLMLEWRPLYAALRQHPLTAAEAILTVAALAAVQMYFVLGFNLVNMPSVPGAEAWLALTCSSLPGYAALGLVAAMSGLVNGSWLGLRALGALALIMLPVIHSCHPIALHRFAPVAALQALIAGLGVWTIATVLPKLRQSLTPTLALSTLLALGILYSHRDQLSRPYVFTQQYELVRRHLAPRGVIRDDCTLMTFNSVAWGDTDLHDFAQVVPGMPVLDCRAADCIGDLARDGCFYYVRSSGCYFHDEGVPAHCLDPVPTEIPTLCLNPTCATFEATAALTPVETFSVDLVDTFPEFARQYPARAPVGLFRVSGVLAIGSIP